MLILPHLLFCLIGYTVPDEHESYCLESSCIQFSYHLAHGYTHSG